MPDVRKRIELEGASVLGSTPAQFETLLKTDMVKWGQIVSESGAQID
jgi:tripartite-type tricarboxylate transporter receptor subunit TctC